MATRLPPLNALRTFEAGRQVVAQSGCLACHKIGENGGTLGPDLTTITSRFKRKDARTARVERTGL